MEKGRGKSYRQFGSLLQGWLTHMEKHSHLNPTIIFTWNRKHSLSLPPPTPNGRQKHTHIHFPSLMNGKLTPAKSEMTCAVHYAAGSHFINVFYSQRVPISICVLLPQGNGAWCWSNSGIWFSQQPAWKTRSFLCHGKGCWNKPSGHHSSLILHWFNSINCFCCLI